MNEKTAKDDKALYEPDFYAERRSPALMAATKALYGRMNSHKESAPAFEDIDIDALDHYYIAARHAVRAFNREAEREVVA